MNTGLSKASGAWRKRSSMAATASTCLASARSKAANCCSTKAVVKTLSSLAKSNFSRIWCRQSPVRAPVGRAKISVAISASVSAGFAATSVASRSGKSDTAACADCDNCVKLVRNHDGLRSRAQVFEPNFSSSGFSGRHGSPGASGRSATARLAGDFSASASQPFFQSVAVGDCAFKNSTGSAKFSLWPFSSHASAVDFFLVEGALTK